MNQLLSPDDMHDMKKRIKSAESFGVWIREEEIADAFFKFMCHLGIYWCGLKKHDNKNEFGEYEDKTVYLYNSSNHELEYTSLKHYRSDPDHQQNFLFELKKEV